MKRTRMLFLCSSSISRWMYLLIRRKSASTSSLSAAILCGEGVKRVLKTPSSRQASGLRTPSHLPVPPRSPAARAPWLTAHCRLMMAMCRGRRRVDAAGRRRCVGHAVAQVALTAVRMKHAMPRRPRLPRSAAYASSVSGRGSAWSQTSMMALCLNSHPLWPWFVGELALRPKGGNLGDKPRPSARLTSSMAWRRTARMAICASSTCLASHQFAAALLGARAPAPDDHCRSGVHPQRHSRMAFSTAVSMPLSQRSITSNAIRRGDVAQLVQP